MKKNTKTPKGYSISALSEMWEADRRTVSTAIRKAGLQPLSHDAQGNPRYDEIDTLDALTKFFPLPPETKAERDESSRCLTLHLLYATEYMEQNPGCSRLEALMAGCERREQEERNRPRVKEVA